MPAAAIEPDTGDAARLAPDPPGRRPQLVVLVGIPGAGKTTFATREFLHTHLRLSRDTLRTRHREQRLFQTALETTTDIVLDDTNVDRAQRAPFISRARAAGYQVVGYYLESRLGDALERNARRPQPRRLPDAAVGGRSAQLELPSPAEGFDQLHFVRIRDGAFIIEEWRG